MITRARIEYRWLVAIAFVAGLFMELMDTTVVNVALPTLGQEFGVGDQTFQWVVTGYLISLAVWIPASGWISDRFGTKRTFLIALLIFTFSSSLCGASWNIQSLIAFRVLQGVGGGMVTPVGTAMLFRAFAPSERAQASAVLTVPTAIAPALGPVLGGWLVDQESWRWIFYVNLPIGIATMVFAYFFLREHTEPAAGGFDLRGFLCAGAGLPLLLYALSAGPSDGWASPQVLVSGVSGIALAGLLLRIERSQPDPMLHLRLFGDRTFRTGLLTMFMAFTMLLGVLYLLPLFLQQLIGLSAFDSGLTTFPQAVALMITAPLTSRLYPRVGPRRMLVIGLTAMAATSALFLLVGVDTNLWWIRAIMFCRGISMSFAVVAAQAATFATIRSEETGRASALFNTSRQVASSVGVAVVSTVLAEAMAFATASAGGTLQAFHDAFAVSIVFGIVGITFALRVRDEDGMASHTRTEKARSRAHGRLPSYRSPTV